MSRQKKKTDEKVAEAEKPAPAAAVVEKPAEVVEEKDGMKEVGLLQVGLILRWYL